MHLFVHMHKYLGWRPTSGNSNRMHEIWQLLACFLIMREVEHLFLMFISHTDFLFCVLSTHPLCPFFFNFK